MGYERNANQRSITTHKEKANNECSDNYYAKINLNALRKAMSSLTPKAFELWMYFSKNQDNYFFWLSKVDFLSWSNVKDSSYYAAFDELERNGYLVKKWDKSNDKTGVCNNYDFYEVPIEEKIGITVHKE